MVVKQPALALPLAFASHFVLDAIPHYNPPGVVAQKFEGFSKNWSKKLASKNFLPIFVVDMTLFVFILLIFPWLAPTGVSPWTVFFSALLAASPDFIGGRFLAYKILGIKHKNSTNKSTFTRFHIWIQWMERPWGLAVEAVWFVLMLAITSVVIHI